MVTANGNLKRVEGNRIVLRNSDGTDADSHLVAAGATVALNGRPCPLSDLRDGDGISLAGDSLSEPATSVIATR